MKADFFKRIFAYLIDYFIIMIVLMGITASVNVGSDLTKEINDVMNDYKEGNITVEEYTEKVMPLIMSLLNGNFQSMLQPLLYSLAIILFFAYFNKGQTLGKKLLKLKLLMIRERDLVFGIWLLEDY